MTRKNGGFCMSFADLKAEVNDIVEDSSTTKKQTFEEKVKDEYIKDIVDPAENESWVQFQQRLFKTHSQEHWSGSITFYALTGVSTINFTWLWGTTTYQVCGYYENVYGRTSAMSIENIPTKAMDAVQPWSITFAGDVLETFETRIRETTSFY
jgi:hypothetical protein